MVIRQKIQLNSLLTNKVMPLQSCKIGCVYKTPFRKSGHIYVLHVFHLLFELVLGVYIMLNKNTLGVKKV